MQSLCADATIRVLTIPSILVTAVTMLRGTVANLNKWSYCVRNITPTLTPPLNAINKITFH